MPRQGVEAGCLDVENISAKCLHNIIPTSLDLERMHADGISAAYEVHSRLINFIYTRKLDLLYKGEQAPDSLMWRTTILCLTNPNEWSKLGPEQLHIFKSAYMRLIKLLQNNNEFSASVPYDVMNFEHYSDFTIHGVIRKSRTCFIAMIPTLLPSSAQLFSNESKKAEPV